MAVWRSEVSQSTMYIDLLGRIENSEEIITSAIRAILEQNVIDVGGEMVWKPLGPWERKVKD